MSCVKSRLVNTSTLFWPSQIKKNSDDNFLKDFCGTFGFKKGLLRSSREVAFGVLRVTVGVLGEIFEALEGTIGVLKDTLGS